MQVSLTIEYTPQYTPLDLMSINVGMKQTAIWIYWRQPKNCCRNCLEVVHGHDESRPGWRSNLSFFVIFVASSWVILRF